MRLVRTEFVGRLEVFVLELFAVQALKGLLCDARFIHGSFEKFCRFFYGFARYQCLPRSGRGAGIRRIAGIARTYPYLRERQACRLGDVLYEHSLASLAYVRSRCVYPRESVFYLYDCSSLVRQAHSDSGVFHRAGYAYPVRRRIVKVRLYRDQGLFQRSRHIGYLPVRKLQTRLDSVAVSYLPRTDPGLFGQNIQKRFERKLALTDAEAPERSRRRVVRIVSVSADVRVVVVIRPHAVGAGSFEHRPAEACISPCIEIYVAVESRQYAVLIASDREGPLHGMPLRVHPQGFASAELRLDRPVELKGGERGYVLRRHILLASEAASDELVLDDDALRRILPSQHDAHLMPCIICALVGR